ncbi:MULTISPECIES: hypothetical protein [Acinetobacter]|uniref:Uncharacterized protein n=1 Tax=Acinetobacter higginsii TaxID=70347 RepID=N9RVT8_9GAMM|nr:MULTISPECIES: hypothetical protein [Acinetobacter]ENX62048.1 hypothetical protein F902_00237 [Acinetobacter higginsii]MCH7296462.1 hypothetical protein [Acinetobacter higginsii]MDO3666651.1 hypothetical protein [Acinetobacter higginsii]
MSTKFLTVLCLSTVLFACTKEMSEKPDQASLDTTKKSIIDKKEKLAPEDDSTLTGTPVLGFKLRDSTFDSVKNRLMNYSVGNESYAGGGILANDGSGFDIEGLFGTQFGFDQKQKLVYVWMGLKEIDHMNHTTYKKVVNYIQQNGYVIIDEKKPFVGSRSTTFKTPNQEIVVVSSPHMGGFKVDVEYMTELFLKQRNDVLQQQKSNQETTEARNF